MRLTNEMRAEFADDVMRQIPIKSTMTRDKIIDQLGVRLRLAQPIEVQGFAKQFPQQTNFTSILVDWLDYRDMDCWKHGRVNCINGSSLDQIETADLREAYEALLNEKGERNTMRERILEVANGCTTTEQLALAFPDMLGLIPKPVKVIKSLPVAAKGLTDELVKMGLEIPV